MAKYRITAPDGHTYEVTAPDDATQDQVMAYAQANYQPQAQKPEMAGPPMPEAAPDPAAGMSGVDRFRAGVGKSFADTFTGVKQAGTESLARGSRAIAGTADAVGLSGVSGAIARNVGVPLDRSLRQQQSGIDETRRLDASLMNTGAGLAGNISGQVVQAGAIPGGAPSMLGKLATSGAIGAGYAGAQPVATGESRGRNTAVGAGLGVAGQGIASGAGALATRATNALSEPVRQSIELARRAGIPLNLSQVTNSAPLKAAQAVTKWLPLSGAGRSMQKQQEAFNAALGRSFGVDGAKALTDDVMRGARQKISKGYEEVFGRNNITVKPDDLRALAGIENEAMQNMTEAESRVVTNQVEKVLRELSDGGSIGGKKYQALREQLRKATDGGKIGQYVKQLRSVLDDAANRSVGPDDAAVLKKLNGQWANLRTTEDALRQIGAQGAGQGSAAGNVRPDALWGLIRKGSTKEMRELAKIGQNVLKEGVGDSGTSQRQYMTALLTGGLGGSVGMLPIAMKGLATGAIAGRALNSNAASRLLGQGAPSRGLAQLLRPAPRALPAMRGLLPAELTVAGGRVATPEEIAQDEEIVRRFREGR